MDELSKIGRIIDRELPEAEGKPFWCWMRPPAKML